GTQRTLTRLLLSAGREPISWSIDSLCAMPLSLRYGSFDTQRLIWSGRRDCSMRDVSAIRQRLSLWKVVVRFTVNKIRPQSIEKQATPSGKYAFDNPLRINQENNSQDSNQILYIFLITNFYFKQHSRNI